MTELVGIAHPRALGEEGQQPALAQDRASRLERVGVTGISLE